MNASTVDPSQRASLHRLLLHRMQQLREEIDAAEHLRHLQTPEAGREVSDQKDVTERSQALDLNDEQERRDIAEAELIESALRRMDAGTYGICADCGEPIPLPRLQVQPAAPRCAGCQAESERRPLR